MKTLRYFLSGLAIVFLFMACSKQKAFAPNAGNFIVIGDAENMLVKHQDTSLYPGYISANQLAIDVDDDRVNDFVFEYTNTGRINWSAVSILLRGTSNNCEFFGTYGIDTTFLLETLETGTALPTAYSSISSYTIHTLNYTCSRISDNCKVSSIHNHGFRVKALDSLAQLTRSTEFGNDTALFYGFNTSNINNQISTTQMLTERTFNQSDCSAFASNKSYYMGIQIHKNNKDYLGWIKFLYLNNAIKLLETAIQKP